MRVTFHGRHKGAIGLGRWFYEEVDCDTLEEAREKLYDRFDHILFLHEVKEGEAWSRFTY